MVLVVPASEVAAALPMGACIAAVERGFIALETEAAGMPLRSVYKLPQQVLLSFCCGQPAHSPCNADFSLAPQEFSVLASMPAFIKGADGKSYCSNK